MFRRPDRTVGSRLMGADGHAPDIRAVGYAFEGESQCHDALMRIKNTPTPYGLTPVYARLGDPTVWACEHVLAKICGATWCVLFPSGMAAIDCAASICQGTDRDQNWTFFDQIYPGTLSYAEDILKQQRGLNVRTLQRDYRQTRAQELAGTKSAFLFAESITNPLLETVDLAILREVKASTGGKIVIDNTLATHLNIQPLQHGADMVVESVGKYIGGNNRIIAGAIFGHADDLGIAVRRQQKKTGAILAPDIADALRRRCETFPDRFGRQCRNAGQLGAFLNATGAFSAVHWATAQNTGDTPQPTSAACVTLAFSSTRAQTAQDRKERFIRRLAPRIAYSTSLGSFATSVMSVDEFFTAKTNDRQYLRVSLGTEAFADIQCSFAEAL